MLPIKKARNRGQMANRLELPSAAREFAAPSLHPSISQRLCLDCKSIFYPSTKHRPNFDLNPIIWKYLVILNTAPAHLDLRKSVEALTKSID